MYCSECGNQIEGGLSYCRKCGKKLDQINIPPDPPTHRKEMGDNSVRICPRCGKHVTYEAAFCQSCGSKLETAAQNINSETQWYYLYDDEQRGPYSEDYIAELIEGKEIDRKTYVWRAGLNEWTMIENTELNHLVQNVIPSLPMSEISDKWLWALATIPIISEALMRQFMPSIISSLDRSIILVILNSLFILLDVAYLMKRHIKLSAWLKTGILLVPIYLFGRAAKTNKHYAPGITWCILVLLSPFL